MHVGALGGASGRSARVPSGRRWERARACWCALERSQAVHSPPPYSPMPTARHATPRAHHGALGPCSGPWVIAGARCRSLGRTCGRCSPSEPYRTHTDEIILYIGVIPDLFHRSPCQGTLPRVRELFYLGGGTAACLGPYGAHETYVARLGGGARMPGMGGGTLACQGDM